MSHHSNEESDKYQAMQEKGTSNKIIEEPVWMVPDDQEIEEWNLSTEDDPKTIQVNKKLPDNFKAKAKMCSLSTEIFLHGNMKT